MPVVMEYQTKFPSGYDLVRFLKLILWSHPDSQILTQQIQCLQTVLMVSSPSASTAAHQSADARGSKRWNSIVRLPLSTTAFAVAPPELLYFLLLYSCLKPPMWIHPLPKQLFNIVLKSECVVRALSGRTFFPLWVLVKTSPPGAQVLPNPLSSKLLPRHDQREALRTLNYSGSFTSVKLNLGSFLERNTFDDRQL